MENVYIRVYKFVNAHSKYHLAMVEVDPNNNDLQPFCVDVLRKFAKRVMRQILIILSELHNRDLVHRFICPESIKWRWNASGKPDVYIGNLFLLTEVKIKFPGDGRKPVPPAPFTGPYYPPEHFIHNRDLASYAHDVYSAGVIFAELLLNELPDTMVMECFGRTFPTAIVTKDPKWRKVDRRLRKIVKNMIDMPLLRYDLSEHLQRSYFK